MKKLLANIRNKFDRIYWSWNLDRRRKCVTLRKGTNYIHKVDVVGVIIETDGIRRAKYGCPSAETWCINNEIYLFGIVERYISSKDSNMHFVFAFKNAEDAMAFRLGYVE